MQKKIIIVGASGYIGGYLFNRFKHEKTSEYKVFGTYSKHKKPGLIHFDLDNFESDDKILEKLNINYMIISAAANANIDNSKRYYESSYKTNVLNIKKLVDYCFTNNIIPIHISSDGVYDGKKGNYSESDGKNSINCYGKMKYEIEEYIFKSSKPFVILRMGRVFGTILNDGTLLTKLLEKIRTEEEMRCIDDVIFTPVYIEEVFDFIKVIIQKKYTGVFHIASLRPVTIYELSKKIEKFFKIKNCKINPCKVESLKLLDKRPKDTSLNIGKYKKLTGFKERRVEYYLKRIKKEKSVRVNTFSH